ncbi:MAG TPA: GntR family transcriptional regulator [Firmicutes bacterium]|nr:GntR family transcriptional regulator [Bacillota bacterium]
MGISFDESIPIYTQIMKSVLWDVATGALLPGDKLLSVRDFAKQAKTNPNTVQRAYAELERMGVVETQRGQGTFVSASPEIAREVRSEMTAAAVESFVEEMRRLLYSDSDIISLVSQQLVKTGTNSSNGAAQNGPSTTNNHDGGVQ